jgi:chemotaxis protein MotB
MKSARAPTQPTPKTREEIEASLYESHSEGHPANATAHAKHRPLAHEEHEGEEGEPWLVSYADMMTLLFGFFVIMYSFAMAKLEDDDSFVKVQRELARYFGGNVVSTTKGAEEEFLKKLKDSGVGDGFQVRSTEDGIIVTMNASTAFPSGSAEVGDSAQKGLLILSGILRTRDPRLRVLVEGHTDDAPLRVRRIYRSNWDLSAARAASVVNLFESSGLDRTLLAATGFADTHPIVPNRDETGQPLPENQARNRRVVIRVKEVGTTSAAPQSPAPEATPSSSSGSGSGSERPVP